MRALGAVCAVLALIAVASATSSIAFVDGGIYVNGQLWLNTGPISFRANGAWCSSADDTLDLLSETMVSHTDEFGAYKAVVQSWVAGPVIVQTSVRIYTNINALRFVQYFPQGAAATNSSAGNTDAISVFPALYTATPHTLNYLTYSTDFALNFMGRWNSQLNNNTAPELGSIEGGFPLILNDPTLATLVISPAENFQVATQILKDNSQYLACGLNGAVTSLPAGYTHSTLFYVGQGFEATIMGWGDLMLGKYGKSRVSLDKDMGLAQLSYWTDNGAYYYYNPQRINGVNVTFEQTMINVGLYIANISLPILVYQLDSWWYYKGPTGGLALWEARPDVFPDGMAAVRNALNWPAMTMHNRWFDPANDYLANYSSSFIVESKVALPIKSDVWFYMMNKSKALGNLDTFEQDWLIDTYLNMQITQSSVTAMSDYFSSMAQAAELLGLTIQYCMPLARHVLESMRFQIVTQIRATNDYQPGNNQWQIAYSGALIYAVGAVPFKDNFWTTVSQPGCTYATGCSEPNTVLQTVVVALSGGPAGIGDGIGSINTTLVRRLIRSDGALLKPSRPALPVDTVFNQFSVKMPPTPLNVWHTYTTFNVTVNGETTPLTWHYVLGAALTSPFALYPSSLNDNGTFVGTSWFSRQGAQFFSESNSWTLPTGSTKNPIGFQYTVFAPQLGDLNFLLLGETSKYITVSGQRFLSIDVKSTGLTVQFGGMENEVVDLEIALFSSTLTFAVYSCPVKSDGYGYLNCQASGSCSC